jgi:putative FmdB family regulatory protein
MTAFLTDMKPFRLAEVGDVECRSLSWVGPGARRASAVIRPLATWEVRRIDELDHLGVDRSDRASSSMVAASSGPTNRSNSGRRRFSPRIRIADLLDRLGWRPRVAGAPHRQAKTVVWAMRTSAGRLGPKWLVDMVEGPMAEHEKGEACSTLRQTRRVMPTYEYRCRDCGHTFDVIQAMSTTRSRSARSAAASSARCSRPRHLVQRVGLHATDHGKKSKSSWRGSPRREIGREVQCEKPSEKPAASTDHSTSEKKDKTGSAKPAEKTAASSSSGGGSSSTSSSDGRRAVTQAEIGVFGGRASMRSRSRPAPSMSTRRTANRRRHP